MSLRASAHTGVAIPRIFRHVPKTFGDSHASDIGHWLGMTGLTDTIYRLILAYN